MLEMKFNSHSLRQFCIFLQYFIFIISIFYKNKSGQTVFNFDRSFRLKLDYFAGMSANTLVNKSQ